ARGDGAVARALDVPQGLHRAVECAAASPATISHMATALSSATRASWARSGHSVGRQWRSPDLVISCSTAIPAPHQWVTEPLRVSFGLCGRQLEAERKTDPLQGPLSSVAESHPALLGLALLVDRTDRRNDRLVGVSHHR